MSVGNPQRINEKHRVLGVGGVADNRVFWSEAKDLTELERDLENFGSTWADSRDYIVSRREFYREILTPVAQYRWLSSAKSDRIEFSDDSGVRIYSPKGGLLPIDFHQLSSVIRDPADSYAIARAILASRLCQYGISRSLIDWQLSQTDSWRDEDQSQYVSEILDIGWSAFADQLSPAINAERLRRVEAKSQHTSEGQRETVKALSLDLFALLSFREGQGRYGVSFGEDAPVSLRRESYICFKSICESEDQTISLESLARKVYGDFNPGQRQRILGNTRLLVHRLNGYLPFARLRRKTTPDLGIKTNFVFATLFRPDKKVTETVTENGRKLF